MATTIDFPDELLAAERAAWTAIQEGRLTVDQAHAVHQAVAAFAEEAGIARYDVETELKRAVRHPETAEA